MLPAKVCLQYCTPQHLLTKLMGRLARWQNQPLKDFVIQKFIKHYGVNMDEAAQSDPKAYIDFHHFFIRKLREDARTIDHDLRAIVSPVDGTISQIGQITQGKIIQAKGMDYSVSSLLGDEHTYFNEGGFATLYLSPKDYHRVHMPFTGKCTAMTYIPGRLFSVNPLTTQTVPSLFARNERVACYFDTPKGRMAVVFVGAMIVGSIHTSWARQIKSKQIKRETYQAPKQINKGDEIGFFTLGSTIILLFEKEMMHWDKHFGADSEIKLGTALGYCL